jgi:hypothetical protein
MVLALAMIPLIVVPLVVELSPGSGRRLPKPEKRDLVPVQR